MRKFNYLSLIVCLIFLIANPGNISAKEKDKKNKNRLSKVTDNPASNVVAINSITSWVGSDGFHDWVINGSWNGEFPTGSSIGAIFAEGIVWGGKVEDGKGQLIRVNGNTYGSGCQSVLNKRVFRVRPDYKTGNLAPDAAAFNQKALGQVTQADIDALQAQYETDWNEWPADEGAIYDDVNNDGVYEPDVDIPGVPGAAQTLFIKYNDNLSSANYGSIPIGLEVSETYWAYAYSGALGNVIYKKVDIVYKGTPESASNSVINDMYIVQWADPDVGTSSDDYAGCDTALNMGYAYTSGDQDATYEAAGYGPPAVGYDFLQGVSQYTGNPNDSAIFNLKWRKGYKYVNSKPMSSFIYFAAGGNWSDPGFDYTGTLQFYNLMRGFKPDPPYPAGEAFPDAVTDVTPTGTFLLTGDPVAGTGKLDGNTSAGGDSPGDRRIMVVNGPINMRLGDTAEVVVALVGGLGSNNVDAVREMKNNDNSAQIVFDQLFKLPVLPPPTVHVEQLSNKIVLDWGNDPASINAIENFDDQGYAFEGYEVYQLPTPSSPLSDGVNIGTFDLINGITTILDTVKQDGILLPKIVIRGTDNGIQRFLTVTKDALKGGTQLKNGQEYYFAVIPYAFNPAPLLPFHALQSSVQIKVGVPQTTVPGVRYSSMSGDTVQMDHSLGTSDGSAFGLVIDPSKTTGHSYKISFDTTGGESTWKVVDVNTGETKASGLKNQTGNNDYPIVDGIMVKVIGPAAGVKQVSELDANDEVVDENVSIIPPSLGTTGYIVDNRAGVANGEFGDRTFDRFLYWGTDDIIIDFTQTSLTWDYINEDVHIDQSTGQPYQAPFAVYRKKFPSGEMVRLFAGFWDTDSNGVWDVDANSWSSPNYGVPSYEPIYCWQGYDANGNEINYDPANDAQYATDNSLYTSANTTFGDATGQFIYPFVTATLICMYADDATLPLGHKIIFITNKSNGLADEFTYTAPAPASTSNELAVNDANRINVFPNPYYGFQSRETSRDAKYVTFSHLPEQATIRIFDLSGVLVRTLNKNDATQFTRWNLQNEDGYPVASGVYVVYVDMPGLGTTKVLKLALVQEEQILKVY